MLEVVDTYTVFREKFAVVTVMKLSRRIVGSLGSQSEK